MPRILHDGSAQTVITIREQSRNGANLPEETVKIPLISPPSHIFLQSLESGLNLERLGIALDG
ncbi:MAG: hypothetical protein WBZ57_17160, partial [Pseudomonas graminis]